MESCQIMAEVTIQSYIFGPLFGCHGRTAFKIKWNYFKHSFNKETFYAFWDVFQATHLAGAIMLPLEGNDFKFGKNYNLMLCY